MKRHDHKCCSDQDIAGNWQAWRCLTVVWGMYHYSDGKNGRWCLTVSLLRIPWAGRRSTGGSARRCSSAGSKAHKQARIQASNAS